MLDINRDIYHIVTNPLTKVIATPSFPPNLGTDTTISPSQNVTQTILENGLTVLTKPVHTAPVVTVQVWYKIGSVDEKPGDNGIAHQLEHMMFQGTTTRPIQYGSLLETLGGDFNAFTGYDQTAYHNTVESNALKTVLMLEGDRLKNALISPAQFDQEKGVVISELQGYENSPEYRLNRAVMTAAFPHHPYGLMIGGTKADVENFTVENVRYYYHLNYRPDNAVLIVVGDFDPSSILTTIQEIFGGIANPDEPPTRVQRGQIPSTFPPSILPSNKPIILQEPGAVPFSQVIYPIPAINHDDIPALNILDYILDNGGRSSRIYRELIDSGIATDAGSTVINLSAGGWLEMWGTTTTTKSLNRLDKAWQKMIVKLQQKLVTTEELDRAKTQIIASSILENRDLTSQAMQLGLDWTTTGNYRYSEDYLKAIAQVTAADVQKVAQIYLKPEYRTLGRFEPTQTKTESITDANTVNSTATKLNIHTPRHHRISEPPDPAAISQYLPEIPPAKVHTITPPESFTLDNGMRVLLLADNSTPSISIRGFVKAGEEFDPPGREGLALLTAENLMSGTVSYNGQSLARRLENRGANIEVRTATEGVDISASALSGDWLLVLETLADVLQNPTFPQKWLELIRQQQISELLESEHNPAYVSHRALQKQLYPKDHPLYIYPTQNSLRAISRSDIQNFHRTYYRPDGTVLVVVGDFDSQLMRSQIETQFGSWKNQTTARKNPWPPVSLPAKFVWLQEEIPGLVESVTVMGHPSIDRHDSRYYAALVLNHILGGSTLSSRLGLELRDRHGLTYGVYSWFNCAWGWGSFNIEMQTAPENAALAIEKTLALLKQVQQQGVTPSEVETAKHSLISSDRVALGDPDFLAGIIMWNEIFQFPPTELNQFYQKIDAVTPSLVNQVARELIHPDRLVVVTSKPAIPTASVGRVTTPK
nr:pitrilysin family protein [Arthrospira platensis]